MCLLPVLAFRATCHSCSGACVGASVCRGLRLGVRLASIRSTGRCASRRLEGRQRRATSELRSVGAGIGAAPLPVRPQPSLLARAHPRLKPHSYLALPLRYIKHSEGRIEELDAVGFEWQQPAPPASREPAVERDEAPARETVGPSSGPSFSPSSGPSFKPSSGPTSARRAAAARDGAPAAAPAGTGYFSGSGLGAPLTAAAGSCPTGSAKVSGT